ncbi:MAG: N-acetylneuraminate synthase family protein, partial [Eubacterium sp.]
TYCQEIGIQFLSTPFDLESIVFLNQLEMPFWKIPSGEITNYPYLVKIAETHKDIVMSTGMCTMKEIEEAINVLEANGSGKISLLHCNTEYPTPMEDVNLRAMQTLKETFNVPVGYSDHTKGIEVPIAAVAMGAEIIEKHFTLDCSMEGPDHKASLEPEALMQMVQAIRNIEKAMGSGKKEPSPSEKKNIPIARKSIVANCDIEKGTVFTVENLTTKRPGNGISPMKWNEILGQKATRYFKEDELITW